MANWSEDFTGYANGAQIDGVNNWVCPSAPNGFYTNNEICYSPTIAFRTGRNVYKTLDTPVAASKELILQFDFWCLIGNVFRLYNSLGQLVGGVRIDRRFELFFLGCCHDEIWFSPQLSSYGTYTGRLTLNTIDKAPVSFEIIGGGKDQIINFSDFNGWSGLYGGDVTMFEHEAQAPYWGGYYTAIDNLFVVSPDVSKQYLHFPRWQSTKFGMRPFY